MTDVEAGTVVGPEQPPAADQPPPPPTLKEIILFSKIAHLKKIIVDKYKPEEEGRTVTDLDPIATFILNNIKESILLSSHDYVKKIYTELIQDITNKLCEINNQNTDTLLNLFPDESTQTFSNGIRERIKNEFNTMTDIDHVKKYYEWIKAQNDKIETDTRAELGKLWSNQPVEKARVNNKLLQIESDITATVQEEKKMLAKARGESTAEEAAAARERARPVVEAARKREREEREAEEKLSDERLETVIKRGKEVGVLSRADAEAQKEATVAAEQRKVKPAGLFSQFSRNKKGGGGSRRNNNNKSKRGKKGKRIKRTRKN